MKAFVIALLLIATPTGDTFSGPERVRLIQDAVGDSCRWGAFGFDVCQQEL